MKTKSSSFALLSGFAIVAMAACGQADVSEPEVDVATAPAEEVASAVTDVIETEAPEVEETTDVSDHSDDQAHQHDSDDHDGHDHGGHDHDEHAGHDHEGHDHDHDHGHGHDHGAGQVHEHGKGDLAVVLEGAALTISFESPLASFASFEHEPKTPEQEQELQSLQDAFMDISTIVRLSEAADCLATSQEVGFRHSGDHGSVSADYEFECGSPNELTSIDFLVFDAYPALESIEAVYLKGSEQSAQTLSAENSSIDVD